jgi:DDE family transposase
VVDRGFTSAANRRYLQRGGGHYIMGEKLRGDSAEAKTALGRAGRYRTVAGNLRVKEVRVDDGTARDRFVICRNPEQASRDADVRGRIVALLQEKITGSDRLPARKRAELAGALKTRPAFNRFLRATASGKLRIDRRAVARDAHFDGKFLLRTSDESLSATDIAEGYKALYEAERGFRDVKSTIDLRPVYHHKEQRILSHVQLCWLALLLRVAETETGDTWRNLRDELERLHLVTLRTAEGTLAQRGELTAVPIICGSRASIRVPKPSPSPASDRPCRTPQAGKADALRQERTSEGGHRRRSPRARRCRRRDRRRRVERHTSR